MLVSTCHKFPPPVRIAPFSCGFIQNDTKNVEAVTLLIVRSPLGLFVKSPIPPVVEEGALVQTTPDVTSLSDSKSAFAAYPVGDKLFGVYTISFAISASALPPAVP